MNEPDCIYSQGLSTQTHSFRAILGVKLAQLIIDTASLSDRAFIE